MKGELHIYPAQNEHQWKSCKNNDGYETIHAPIMQEMHISGSMSQLTMHKQLSKAKPLLWKPMNISMHTSCVSHY